MTAMQLTQIAGSAFSLVLSTDTCPIITAPGGDIDTGAWGAHLELAREHAKIKVPGAWVSSLTPWSLRFTDDQTAGWPVGVYELRLAYLSPETPPRQFVQPLGMTVNVIR